MCNHLFVFSLFRAEPVLTRIKENRKRVISPSFDNIKYDNFELEEYPLSAQGFDWELWCRYLNPPKSWWKLENTTAPIRYSSLTDGTIEYVVICPEMDTVKYPGLLYILGDTHALFIGCKYKDVFLETPTE